MVIINPIFMSKLSKIFPEISDQKIEILTFFCLRDEYKRHCLL